MVVLFQYAVVWLVILRFALDLCICTSQGIVC